MSYDPHIAETIRQNLSPDERIVSLLRRHVSNGVFILFVLGAALAFEVFTQPGERINLQWWGFLWFILFMIAVGIYNIFEIRRTILTSDQRLYSRRTGAFLNDPWAW